jgi:hypothetical protein
MVRTTPLFRLICHPLHIAERLSQRALHCFIGKTLDSPKADLHALAVCVVPVTAHHCTFGRASAARWARCVIRHRQPDAGSFLLTGGVPKGGVASAT